jgi:outer membrane protein OmpA-like peptidoglycan-associated protein
MKVLPIVCTLAVALAAGGCATKNYVHKSIDPLNAKMDEQGRTLAETGQSVQKIQQMLEANETSLSATNERAVSADARAGDALNRASDAANKANDAASKADAAARRADQVSGDLASLKSQVAADIASLDDYKKTSSVSVAFRFNSDKLDPSAKAQLDQMAGGNNYKRYFIAVEGFTDKSGNEAYNAALSRRRADAVVAYLVSQHNVPVYRIHMIGLGEANPVDEGNSRNARAKNRRVEVTVFSADHDGPMARN